MSCKLILLEILETLNLQRVSRCNCAGIDTEGTTTYFGFTFYSHFHFRYWH